LFSSIEETPVISHGEAVEAFEVKTHEETVFAEEQSQIDEDPLERLRRRLTDDSEGKSEPVFGSGLLSVASA